MSIDDSAGLNKRTNQRHSIKGAALGAAAILGGGLAGVDAGIEKAMEQINARLLTPAAIYHLKKETGATDSDISELEPELKKHIRDELNRYVKERKERLAG